MRLSPKKQLILVSLAFVATLAAVFGSISSADSAGYRVTVDLRESRARATISTHNVSVTGDDGGPNGSRMIATDENGNLLYDIAVRIETEPDIPILAIDVDTRRPLRLEIRVYSVSCSINGVSADLEDGECVLPRGTHEIRLEVLDPVNGTSRAKSAAVKGRSAAA